MNKMNAVFILSFLFLFIACNPTPPANNQDNSGTTSLEQSELILYIAPELVECGGAEAKLCMMVKEKKEEEYRPFYDQIDNFAYYTEGFEYKVRLSISPVENPSADEARMIYRVVEVISKTAVSIPETAPLTFEDKMWQLDNYRADGQLIAATTSGSYTFTPATEKYPAQIDGFTGCNNISVTYTMDGQKLTFGMGISTQKACGELMDKQETGINTAMRSIISYDMDGERLLMMDSSGTVLLQFSVIEELPLTDTLWQATSVDNGAGASIQLLPETTVTAVFSNNNSISGNASCNMYNTTYEIRGDALRVDPSIITTRRACTEPIAAQEGLFLAALSNGTHYSIRGNRLDLRGEDDVLYLSFTAVPPLPLIGTRWKAIAYNSGGGAMVGVMDGTMITAVFDEEGKFSGDAGCNSYFSDYTTDNSSLRIGNELAKTTMDCPDEKVMTQESGYTAALRDVTTYSINDNTLELHTADGSLAASYVAVKERHLANSEWTIHAYNDGNGGVVTVIADTDITMTFDDDGNVSGSAGCNQYNGRYEAGNEALSFGTIQSTQKMCIEPKVMEQEAAFLAALTTVNSYHIDGDQIIIRDEHGSIAIQLKAAE